jgi:hypothetical protein
MDAIGTGGGLSIVPITQPIATPAAVASVAGMSKRPLTASQVSAAVREGNRSLPITMAETACEFTPVTNSRLSDEVVVELSAPLVHPSPPAGAGMFARVSVGNEPEWYWVALAPNGTEWGVRWINAIDK